MGQEDSTLGHLIEKICEDGSERLNQDSLNHETNYSDFLELLERAKQHAYHGRVLASREILEDLVRRWPNEALGYYYLGNVMSQSGDINEAVANWKRALSIDSSLGDARYLIKRAKYAVEWRENAEFSTGKSSDSAPYIIAPSEATLENLRRLFRQYGVVVIRGGLCTTVVEKFRENFKSNLENAYLPSLTKGAKRDDIHLPIHYMIADGIRADKLRGFTRKNISIKNVGEWDWKSLNHLVDVSSIASEILATGELEEYIKNAIGEDYYHWREASYVRRVISGERHVGVPFHQDSGTGYWQKLALVVWVPMVTCGEDAPGLEILPRGFSELFPWKMEDPNNEKSYRFSAEPMLIDPSGVTALSLSAGDLVIFNNFTLHRTQILSTKGERLSFDLRFLPKGMP